jgi:hypothetical protein
MVTGKVVQDKVCPECEGQKKAWAACPPCKGEGRVPITEEISSLRAQLALEKQNLAATALAYMNVQEAWETVIKLNIERKLCPPPYDVGDECCPLCADAEQFCTPCWQSYSMVEKRSEVG